MIARAARSRRDSPVTSVSTNSKNGSTQSTVTTTNAYTWWDGPAQASTNVVTDYVSGGPADTNYTTTFTNGNSGQLISATIGDGRPRTVTFTTDMAGQVIRRDEADDGGGYVAEARNNGGVWYETSPSVHGIMTEGLQGLAVSNKEWVPNEAFIRQRLEAGVGRFDSTGPWQARMESNPNSGLAREYRYLQANAPSYGYYWNGVSWIRR